MQITGAMAVEIVAVFGIFILLISFTEAMR